MTDKKPVGFLIDPIEQKIAIVDINDGSLEVIRKFVGAPWLDAVTISDQLTMWVDDEGLYAPNQKFFALKSYTMPFAGKAVIVPANKESGEVIKTSEADHAYLLDLVQSSVKFLTREEALVLAGIHDEAAAEAAKEYEEQGFAVVTTSVADAINSGVYTDSSD